MEKTIIKFNPKTKICLLVITLILLLSQSVCAAGEAIEAPAQEGSTIANTESKYTIEADTILKGDGSGYHAKLVACTSESAVSFGIQYDEHAPDPYTGEAAFIIENVLSNDPGGQSYTRTGFAKLGQPYRLMLTLNDNGLCSVYVNGVKVGEVSNPNLANQKVYLRVEGSGRRNGDTVNAAFTNIKLKGHDEYVEDMTWGTQAFLTNDGIKADNTYKETRTVLINGTVEGLSSSGEWDSEYGSVSGIIQFVEPRVSHVALAIKAWWKDMMASEFVQSMISRAQEFPNMLQDALESSKANNSFPELQN